MPLRGHTIERWPPTPAGPILVLDEPQTQGDLQYRGWCEGQKMHNSGLQPAEQCPSQWIEKSEN